MHFYFINLINFISPSKVQLGLFFFAPTMTYVLETMSAVNWRGIRNT